MPSTSAAINPWIVAAAVVIPTFMEVLDTTVANVALRYMAGSLSAAVTDAEWVITSYLAANAFILPITGWLAQRFGRRNYFLMSIAVFTIASGLCGMATSLEQLILFRILQGLAGGGLQPSSQGILIDSFPREKQGAAMTLFGVAALLAPVIGPTLGGYLTVNYDWRWIFFINLPVGALGLVACYFLIQDPEYLRQEREKLKLRPTKFDRIGLGLLALVMSSWEVILSKGQEWDWLGDPYWRLQILFVAFGLGLGILIFRELTIANPIVNFRVLFERNLAVACAIVFFAYSVLYGASTSLPGLLQSLFGYDAYVSGLVMSPSGVFSIMMLGVVGTLITRGTDARWLIGTGLFVMASGCYWMSVLNLEISPWNVVWPRVVIITGLSMVFAPLNVSAYLFTPQHLRGAAVGLFALLRNEGGSFGTTVAKIIQERRAQFHTSRVGEFLDPLNPQVNSFLEQAQAFYLQQSGDAAASQQLAIHALQQLQTRQALSLAYFDIFFAGSVLGISLIGLVALMKRSVAAKGAQIHAE